MVLTKRDLVEEEFLALVEEDVEACVRGTFLEGRPVVPVSALTGQGLEVLREELGRLVDRGAPRPRTGAFFLPIDRAFPISGFGTVVTGTAYRGVLREGGDVENPSPGRALQGPQPPGARGTGAGGHRGAAGGGEHPLRIRGIPPAGGRAGRVGGLPGDLLSGGAAAAASRGPGTGAALAEAPAPPGDHRRGGPGGLPGSGAPAPGGGDGWPSWWRRSPWRRCGGEPFVVRFYSPLQTIGGGEVLFAYGEKPRGARPREARRVLPDAPSGGRHGTRAGGGVPGPGRVCSPLPASGGPSGTGGSFAPPAGGGEIRSLGPPSRVRPPGPLGDHPPKGPGGASASSGGVP